MEEYGPVVTSHIVKYPDCNSTKNLFGGQLLAWIDESAAIFAASHMGSKHIVTKVVGSLEFKVPTELHKVLSIRASVIHEGQTSLIVRAVATKKDMGSDKEIKVAETEIVFVSVNDIGTEKVIWKPERFYKDYEEAKQTIDSGKCVICGNTIGSKEVSDGNVAYGCFKCGKAGILNRKIEKYYLSRLGNGS
jgi:acyl-CoA hydrolase